MKSTILVDHSSVIITMHLVCLNHVPEYRRFLKEIMQFHYMTYVYALAKNPCPRGHEIYNFCRPFHGHHTCILTLSVLCLGVEKILREIMHFHYLTYMATKLHKNPYPRGHEIYNFCLLTLQLLHIQFG